MSTDNAPSTQLSRDELVALIAKTHQSAVYGDSTLAGKMLAEQSKLPRLVAENLGAGFGQWDFFPEATEIGGGHLGAGSCLGIGRRCRATNDALPRRQGDPAA